MVKLIAETAWHHEGDFEFMRDLISQICKTKANYVKMHITLDLDEYMHHDHDAYKTLSSWMFCEEQWESLIAIVRANKKGLMLLLNDTKAIDFAARFSPEIVEIHSVCANVPRLQARMLKQFDSSTKIVLGVGGCSIQEVDAAIAEFLGREVVLMFGFQNYPTKYEDINLGKVRKIQALYSGKTFGYADHTAWNEKNNELITMFVASNGMDYIEKHVTTAYGSERCDYAAAISMEMFDKLAEKIKLLNQVYGDGLLGLNSGEKVYSQYGPMKMAAVTKKGLSLGDTFGHDSFSFCRTQQKTSMSQLDILSMLGKNIYKNTSKGKVIDWEVFNE